MNIGIILFVIFPVCPPFNLFYEVIKLVRKGITSGFPINFSARGKNGLQGGFSQIVGGGMGVEGGIPRDSVVTIGLIIIIVYLIVI